MQACGRGFHEQCYPSGTVDLAMSFTAMHWLSASPASLVGDADRMHAAQCGAGGGEAAAAEQAQAARDWRAIMAARAKELREGDSMIQ